MNKGLFSTGCVLALMFGFLSAQERPKDDTITVSGSSTIQLSADEIVIKIDIGEYWLDAKQSEKVIIAEIEKKVIAALKSAGVKGGNITHSAVRLKRDYDSRTRRYGKRGLEKSLNICVYTADDIAKVLASLEAAGLLERAVKSFSISELRHTKKEEFEKKAKIAAIKDAKAKAELIVGALDKSLGEIVTIEEGGMTQRNRGESFYGTADDGGLNTSGVSPIAISYNLKAVFKIK